MMPRPILAAALLGLSAGAAQAGNLTLFATGDDLATEGFRAPALTRDGWQLDFSRVIATFGAVTAWRTDPPFAADGPQISGDALAFGGPFTVDLVAADDANLVELDSRPAAAGHYNALSWALVPAPEGEFAGFSLVFEGTATRDGETVAFTLVSRDAVAYACGEYVGDARKGFVTADAGGDLEITLHLDHLFGTAAQPADSAVNRDAPGFDAFAGGGLHEFSMEGLHLGHVGEGHCHDSAP